MSGKLLVAGLAFVMCVCSSIIVGVGFTQGWFDSILGKTTTSGSGAGSGSGSGSGKSGSGSGSGSVKSGSGSGGSVAGSGADSNTCTQFYYNGPIADNAAAQGGFCARACTSYQPTSTFTGQWTNEGLRGCECKWPSTGECPTGNAMAPGTVAKVFASLFSK